MGMPSINIIFRELAKTFEQRNDNGIVALVLANNSGMNPKEYYKVIRFQRILYMLQDNPEMEFTDLSYLCGFYDPSHLVKDFREFSGCSPTQYLSSRSPYSKFFSKDCRLNSIKYH